MEPTVVYLVRSRLGNSKAASAPESPAIVEAIAKA